MKKLLLILALLFAPSLAWGQCNGAFAPNTLCGNLGASANVPGPVSSAGIPTGVVNTVTANYSIASTDCGKTIQAGTGATGQFTITLPIVAGFDPNCTVSIYNSDTTRGKILSGFPAPSYAVLYPTQSITVNIINGAWVVREFPGRWRLPTSITVFIDNVLGSSSNDCLAAGTGGACLSPLTPINRVMAQVDAANVTITIQFAGGQTYNNLTYQGGLVGLLSGVIIDGGGSTFTSTTAAEAFLINSVSGELLTLQNMVVTNSGSGDGIYVHTGNVVTGPGMVFGAVSHFHIHTQFTSQYNAAAAYTINGGAQSHIFSEANSVFNLAAVVVTLSGTPAFSVAFTQATSNSTQAYFGTFSGSATGKRYIISNNGAVITNGAGQTYLPGNAAGSVSTGGNYDSPGTPIISACGGSPAAPSGSDLSGSVVEGTTATGCVVTFTTANAPKACSVSISNATAQAGLVITTLTSTAVTVTHPSVSGASLYWNCPAN